MKYSDGKKRNAMQNNNFIYKTETHLHTSETSPCSHISASEIVKRYAELGFTTVFVTDHYRWELYGEGKIQSAVEEQLRGYRAVKAAGEPLGLTVLLGCEICFDGKDYLLYGVNEKTFEDPAVYQLKNPLELKKYCEGKNITVIGAHPFREWRTPVLEAVDGIEIINNSTGDFPESNNDKAQALAKELPYLLTSSGSDAHDPDDMGRGGIMTEEPIRSPEDYIRVLKNRSSRLIDNPPTLL